MKSPSYYLNRLVPHRRKVVRGPLVGTATFIQSASLFYLLNLPHSTIEKRIPEQLSESMSGIKGETDGICVLSFDNGGPGTYSQLLILKEYMSRLASDLVVAEDDVCPADYFDLIGGVGFGGLVAFMLGRLRMNVNQAIDELLALTDLLSFDDSNGDIDREKNSNILRESLENMLQTRGITLDTKMTETDSSSENSKVVIYAAAAANITHPNAFRTYPARGFNPDPTIVEALCATMAIQSHFLPVKIGPPRRQKPFVGGAFGANNPTRLLLEEASNIYGKERRVAQIVSLGCGLPQVLSMNSSDRQDTDNALKEMTADCERVANELATRLLNIDAYVRLNVNRGMETVRMEEWDDLGAIETHTASYLTITFVSGSIDTSLRCLKERAGAVTLGQINHSSYIKVTAKTAPLVSPYFVPRKEPWQMMVNHLVSSISLQQKIFPITGMGGCGKTQLVSYFLQQYPNLYTQTVYVDASSSSSIKTDLQTWARTIGGGRERDAWEDALRALNNVTQGEQWVLVLDNADDPTLDLIPFLPKSVHVTVLITSRNRNFGNLSTTHHLELREMGIDEAMAALLKAARRQLPLPDREMRDVEDLLKELGYLAVALVQAGTYCFQLSSTVGGVHRPYTFSQYLSLFNSHRADLMKKEGPTSLDSYQRGVYTTLDLSYKALPQESRDFLHLISFFHHTDIPLSGFAEAARSGFEDPFPYLPRPDDHEAIISGLKRILCADAGWNDLRVQELIHNLRSFSLVIASSMDDRLFLQIHPLIQAWSRDMYSIASQPYQAMSIQVLTACGSEENFELNRFLLPHLLDMLGRTEPDHLHVNDLTAYGMVLRQQGQYRKAGNLYEISLEVMRDSTDSSSISILQVTSLLASSYWDQGRWAEAEKLDVEVLEQRRKILGMEHPDTIRAVANLAMTYADQGRWTEAEKLEVEVLEQRRRILGMEHPDTILATAILASTYHAQGRWTEAEELQVGVLEQQRRILGIEHPNTIGAAGNLASTYHAQGRWTEAEKLKVEVLEQRRRILGMEHPDTIQAAANLASIYRNQGRWTEAEKLDVEVLEQRRRILGMEHPDTIHAAANLAGTYGGQGRWTEAEKLEVEVLEQRSRILGMGHPDTILAAANLARTYADQGRWEEAEKLEVEVLEQRRRILGMEHPDTIRAAANLAATYGKQDRWEEDAALLASAVPLSLKVLGRRHPDTQRYVEDLAFVYDQLGKSQEAEETRALLL